MARAPLPKLFGTHSMAKDWLTGEVSSDVVFRGGKWWTSQHWRTNGRDVERDRRRLERNQDLKAYLASQPADPGL